MERRQKILIVDDERGIRDALAPFLVARGYEVLTAQNVREASKLMERKEPDLLMLDMRMPGVSGEEFLTYLRIRERIEQRDRLPVIIISGALTQHLVPRLIKLGADGIVAKPMNMERIVKEIEGVLRRDRRGERAGGEGEKSSKDIPEDSVGEAEGGSEGETGDTLRQHIGRALGVEFENGVKVYTVQIQKVFPNRGDALLVVCGDTKIIGPDGSKLAELETLTFVPLGIARLTEVSNPATWWAKGSSAVVL